MRIYIKLDQSIWYIWTRLLRKLRGSKKASFAQTEMWMDLISGPLSLQSGHPRNISIRYRSKYNFDGLIDRIGGEKKDKKRGGCGIRIQKRKSYTEEKSKIFDFRSISRVGMRSIRSGILPTKVKKFTKSGQIIDNFHPLFFPIFSFFSIFSPPSFC